MAERGRRDDLFVSVVGEMFGECKNLCFFIPTPSAMECDTVGPVVVDSEHIYE